MRVSSLVVPVLFLSLAATGCRNGESFSPFSFSGPIDSSDAVMGVVTDGDRTTVYVAGGPTTLETMTRWFEGDSTELATGIEAEGWIVSATQNEAAIGQPLIGTLVSPQSQSFAFSLATATPGSVEGLYAALDAGCLTGVVVRAGLPGQQPLLQGVWCSSSGSVEEVAPVVTPLALEDGAITVTVAAPAGDREIQVRPYLP